MSFKFLLSQLEETALHCAAEGGKVEAVKTLIRLGADVNAHDEVSASFKKAKGDSLGVEKQMTVPKISKSSFHKFCQSVNHTLIQCSRVRV